MELEIVSFHFPLGWLQRKGSEFLPEAGTCIFFVESGANF
jgi:hypothetical protein